MMGSFSVYTYWMKAREEHTLQRSGELADVLACLQAGAAWFARRNNKRLCEGPPERRQPGAQRFTHADADAQYLWPLILEQDAPRSGHTFRSAMGSRYCSMWIGEHWNGSGAHCGKTAAEHGALLERAAPAPKPSVDICAHGVALSDGCLKCGRVIHRRGTRVHRAHEPLCVDKAGHPHDNECECWCHDEDESDSDSKEER